MEYQKKPNDFGCFRCVIEQWALTVIKLLRFFCINICCFSIRFIFLYHSGTVIQVSSKLWMFLISTPHKIRTFTVRLAVTTKYQGNGFAVEVLLGRDHPRVVPIAPIVRGVIAFPILGTWWDATTQVASQSDHWQTSWHFEYFPTTTVRHFKF